MDNHEKINILVDVIGRDKDSARAIIDQAKIDAGDDAVFIAELERVYNEKQG